MLKLKNILFPISVRYNSNTIYALSSGHGTCGVAVIRITGMFSALKTQKKCTILGNQIFFFREIKAKLSWIFEEKLFFRILHENLNYFSFSNF